MGILGSQVAGTNFAEQTVSGSRPVRLEIASYTPAQNETITEVQFFCWNKGATAQTIPVGIYRADTDALASTVTLSVPNNGDYAWITATGLSVALTSGIEYKIALGCPSTSTVNFRTTALTGGSANGGTFPALPDPWTQHNALVDSAFGLYAVTAAAGGADTTAPTFDAAANVTATSSTGHTVSSTLNETGTLYGVRLASGATAPSSVQVKAGQNNTGAAALEAVSVAATAATSADLTFSTGAASTAYDYYIVAQDDEGTPNLQAAPTLVSATTAAAAVPGIGQLTVQFEGVAINVADWHIIVRLVADQSILYNQTGQSSNVSGNIAAFATVSGNVGDAVRVEGHSVANAYSFVIKQSLGTIT
jgi:hypothetical protein